MKSPGCSLQADENPPRLIRGPSDHKGIKQARQFLLGYVHPDRLAARLGREPTRAEVRQAEENFKRVKRLGWRQLNDLLREIIEVAPEVSPRRRRYRQPEEQDPRLQTLTMAATRELQRRYGPVWRWLQDEDAPRGTLSGRQLDRVNEVIVLWLQEGNALEDVQATPQGLSARIVREPASLRLLQTVDPIALQVYRTYGQMDREIISGEAVEAAARTTEGERAYRAGRERWARQEEAFEEKLEQIEGQGPLGKARAAIIQMHLGRVVVPGQPARLRGARPAEELARFHRTAALGATPGPCPTCRAIARFYRVRGLGPEEIAALVDRFLFEARQEVG